MEANSATFVFLLSSLLSVSISTVYSSPIQEDLAQKPPSDFNITIATNCLQNPAQRYCNRSETEIVEIFKSFVVAKHLCNESKVPDCNNSFTQINLQERPEIASLYLSFSAFWKFCPLTILTINLSHNSLKGFFPSQILRCTQITSLDLSHNSLVGPIPAQDFSRLTDLVFLNLSYNHFSGDRALKSQFFKRFNSSSFINFGFSDRKFVVESTIILLGFMIFVVSIVGCSGFLFLQRPDFLPAFFNRKNKFTPAMLRAAANGFSSTNLVGKNGSFEIYSGVLRDGREVEIEICRERTSSEVRIEFADNCRTLVQIQHKNLIEVYGWCERRKFRAVVKAWVGNRSVENLLKQGKLTWKHRLKVLMGVAEAMCYLEERWPRVSYDLRSSTVVLAEDGEPLITRLKVGDQISSSKRVYKFGVFLLELIANRRPHEEFDRGEAEFVEWMGMHYPGQVRKVMDERMKKTVATYEQVTQLMAIGLTCTNSSPDRRPRVGQILSMIYVVYESWMRASLAHKRSRTGRQLNANS